MILLWLTIAKALSALASAELKILRTGTSTEFAAVKLVLWMFMQCHKLDTLCVPSSVWPCHCQSCHSQGKLALQTKLQWWWLRIGAMTIVKVGSWKCNQIATQNGLTILSYHSSGNAVITFINSYSFPYPPADLVCLSATPWAFGLSLVTMNQTLLYVTEAPEAHLHIVK